MRGIQLNRSIQRLLETKHLTRREAEQLLSQGRPEFNEREFSETWLPYLTSTTCLCPSFPTR
jgi:hypothetical protein